MMLPRARLLEVYAARIVRMGVNLQRGQALVLAAPVEAADLAERVADAAYACGGGEVTFVWDRPDLLRSRVQGHSIEPWLAEAAALSQGIVAKLRGGAAHVTLHAPRPDVLEGVVLDRIAAAHAALDEARQEERWLLANRSTNASSALFPTTAWACRVFPDCTAATATAALWEVLLAGLQIDRDDVEVRRDLVRIARRCERLQALGLHALEIVGTGTRIRIALASQHLWVGGEARSARGIQFVPTLPFGTIMTAPALGVSEGTLALSRPIAVAGDRVEGALVRFAAGEVVEVAAPRGEAVLRRLLDCDAGARRLGKIALVERTAPFADLGLKFVNPMLDSLASSHVALGATSPDTLPEGIVGNRSMLHLDAMFGDADLTVDGIAHDGHHPLMRDGRFVPGLSPASD